MSRAVRLIFSELRFRKLNAALSLLSVTAAAALFVAFYTLTEAQERETRRVTRDLGFNLRIVSRETEMDRFYADGFSEKTLSEDAVHRLVQHPNLSYNHLVATLQGRYQLQGNDVLLTGISPEYAPPGRKKKPMIFSIERGKAYVGFHVAQRLGLRQGDPLELGGRTFHVERTLAESGTNDDIRITANLADVQAVLGLPGRINEIKAIDCLCLTPDENPLGILRSELEAAVPEAKVVMLRSMAETRARQRQSAEKYFALLTPIILIGCAICIGALAMLNVNDRRQEIGLFRAMGNSSASVMGLFLGKAVIIGVIGALLGYFAGLELAVAFGPHIFPQTSAAIGFSANLFGLALFAVPAFTVLASFLPAAAAATQDPAVVLREG